MDEGERKKIREAFKAWEDEMVKKTVTKAPERQDRFETHSGIPVERLYSPLDLDAWDYQEKLGFPGQYPFTRGIQPTMYRGRLWTMRQYAGFATPSLTRIS